MTIQKLTMAHQTTKQVLAAQNTNLLTKPLQMIIRFLKKIFTSKQEFEVWYKIYKMHCLGFQLKFSCYHVNHPLKVKNARIILKDINIIKTSYYICRHDITPVVPNQQPAGPNF